MALKVNIGTRGILISAIVLVISVLLLIDRLLATGPVQLILEDGRAIPIEGVSYFSLNEVLFFIITAWLGGMSFLYIILFSKEKETLELKGDIAGIPEDKNAALLYGLGFGSVHPTLIALLVDKVGERGRGAAMGTFTAAFDLGIGAGSIVLGMVLQFFGFKVMYLLGGLIVLAGAAWFIAVNDKKGI